MLDRIPERLRTAAEGVEKATQMMAEAKSKRNQAAGDIGACYSGLSKERTAEWQAAGMIERYEAALRDIARQNLSSEMDEDQHDRADWEGGYDAVVAVARKALQPL